LAGVDLVDGCFQISKHFALQQAINDHYYILKNNVTYYEFLEFAIYVDTCETVKQGNTTIKAMFVNFA
jgi:hypothetical protein